MNNDCDPFLQISGIEKSDQNIIVVSGFHHGVNEVCVLLKFYAPKIPKWRNYLVKTFIQLSIGLIYFILNRWWIFLLQFHKAVG